MTKSIKLLVSLFLIVICIIQLLPFYLALTTSFKAQSDLSSIWNFPFSKMTLDNFKSAIDNGNIIQAIINSAVIALSTTILVCVLGALAAYPLARRPTFLNKTILVITLGVMMVPPLSILVPLYDMLNKFNLLNTYIGLVLPIACLALPQAIFLYTQFIKSLPVALEEAALVEGANRLQIFFLVVFPVLKPVTATVIILTAVGAWNEFALSTYIMNISETRTLAPAIASFFGSQGANVNAAVAASLLGVIPVVIAYVFLQRYFMKGSLAGAEK